jgi:hypothetical protein
MHPAAPRLILGLVCSVAFIAPAARAQTVEIRERTARMSCLSGDYAKGVALLSELFVDSRNPTYIYNQGRCFEQNRRYEDAIGRFQEYLRAGRDLSPEDTANANKHIADCKQLLSEQIGPVAPPSAAPVPVPTPTPAANAAGAKEPASLGVATVTGAPPAPSGATGSGLRVAGIVVAAAGVVGVAGGILSTLKANSLASDMETLDGYTADKESSRKTYRTLGIVGYGVGAAGIVAGGLLYFLGARSGASPSSGVAFVPVVSPNAAGAAITGVF